MPNTSITFPASPAVNQQYTYGTTTYVWTGVSWMTYIDSASLSPTNPAAMNRQIFSGTGAQTVFTLASDPGALGNGTNIYINGVYQQRSTYTTVGTTLTFSSAPVAGTNNIEFVSFVLSSIGTTSADLVTYTPSGVGAVARSTSSKLGDTVSVKDFGAVGDGMVDDTAAIQLAITAGANKTIYIPAGTYVVTALTVSSPCRLFGEGVLKKTTASNTAFLTIAANDVDVENLVLLGSSVDTTPATVAFLDTAIKLYGTNSVTPYRRINLSNLKINGFTGFAMDIRHCEDLTVSSCVIRYCGYAGIGLSSVVRGVIANNLVSFIHSTGAIDDRYGIFLSRDPTITLLNAAPTQEVTVIGNVVTDVPVWTGIDGHAPLNCSIIGNVVARCANGIYAQYDSATHPYRMPARNVRIADNVVIGNTTLNTNRMGIQSLGSLAVGAPNENILIENNFVSGCGSWTGAPGALGLNHSNHSIIRNNTIHKAIGMGLYMGSTCTACTIEDNKVNGVYGLTGAGSAMFANIHPTHTACLFRNNQFKNTTGDSAYQAYTGILYVTANTGTLYQGNRIDATSLITTSGPVQRFIDSAGGSTPNTYTDLPWVLESESCIPFVHTTVGGTLSEATASQLANFRRTPATGWTTGSTIQRVRVSHRATDATYKLAVRPKEGNIYTVGVYTVDGTNITASLTIPDIYITIEGIYWND